MTRWLTMVGCPLVISSKIKLCQFSLVTLVCVHSYSIYTLYAMLRSICNVMVIVWLILAERGDRSL